jgi:hypothetical protein
LISTVAFGIAGGIGGEVIALYELRSVPPIHRPPFDGLYWGTAIALVLLAGVLVFAYAQNDRLSAILALQVGLSTPTILRRGRRALPDLDPGTVG